MSRVHKFSWKKDRPEKTAAVCRWGGIGDMVQASSILPGLKAQGFHITMYCTEMGKDILRHDPHIDAWVIQDKDQVPNGALGSYWEYLTKKYDRFINLSESVEGAFLALPGRICHSWPQEVRHQYFNKNYLEFAHELAGVPLPPRQKFYPTPDEVSWAKRQVSNLNGFVIMWSLSGSSVHKHWPHLDTVLARLMLEHPDSRVILCGDDICKLLEEGWDKEKRIKCMSGKLSIRQSLTLAQHVDLVVGSETGLLNAVGLEEVPKVITLSHSSVENLTKHWKNTTNLTPVDVDCYPCHRMHYGWKYCRIDAKGEAAACQTNISADVKYAAIEKWIEKWHNK